MALIRDEPPHGRRAVFLSPAWPPGLSANGIATYVANVRQGLSRIGVESRVIAPAHHPSPRDPDVVNLTALGDTASLPARLLYRAYERLLGGHAVELRYGHAVARAWHQLVASWPADLLEIEESFGIGAVVAPLIAAPVVVRLHGPWFMLAEAQALPRDWVYRHRVLSETRGLRAASALSTPSRYVLDRVARTLPVQLPPATVIANPAPAVAEADFWRRESADPNTVLFVGRFDRLKGGDILVAAFARLTAARPSLKLVLAGPDRGLVDKRGLSWSLPDYLAHHLPLDARGRVTCLGELPASELALLRRRAAVTVVTSRFETFSMTVLEAMAHGSPLVATRVGGIPEVATDGETALLVPAADSESLAAAIARLLDNPELGSRLGAQAAAVARTQFSSDRLARQSRAFYDEVCGRWRAGRH